MCVSAIQHPFFFIYSTMKAIPVDGMALRSRSCLPASDTPETSAHIPTRCHCWHISWRTAKMWMATLARARAVWQWWNLYHFCHGCTMDCLLKIKEPSISETEGILYRHLTWTSTTSSKSRRVFPQFNTPILQLTTFIYKAHSDNMFCAVKVACYIKCL